MSSSFVVPLWLYASTHELVTHVYMYKQIPIFKMYKEGSFSVQSIFPVIHKVGNIGIFAQLLMRISKKQLLVELILMQIYIWYDALK